MTRLDYENARLRFLKSELLDVGFYEKLLDARSPDEMVTIFSETCYKDDVSSSVIKKPGYPGIEDGLKQNLARCFSRISRFFSEENRFLVSALLGRYDIWNVKAVIRGKHIGASAQEIMEAVLPAGELTEPLVIRLIDSPDVKTVIDLLTIWGFPFSRALRDAYENYRKTGKLVDVELPLDRYFYDETLKELSEHRGNFDAQLVREFFRQEIDFLNIMTAIRLAAEGYNPDESEKFFVAGGRKFGLEDYKKAIAGQDVNMMLAVLAGTPYEKAAEEGIKRYLKTGFISSFQRAFEEFLVRAANKLFLADPLSSAVLIAYIWTKHNEVTNLRVIVRGKSVGMREEEIREVMVVV